MSIIAESSSRIVCEGAIRFGQGDVVSNRQQCCFCEEVGSVGSYPMAMF